MITALGFVVAAALGAASRGAILVRLNALHRLPWGTLVVNISGSFALGWVVGIAPPWLTVIGTGALGAYTTFSTFALEVVRLLEDGEPKLAVLHVALMLTACVGAAWIGLSISPNG
jgi:CrcB protein